MKFNNEQVKMFLPHRDPFLFIDSVSEVNVAEGLAVKEIYEVKDLLGCEVIAHYKTKNDHPIFAGHFPGNPILPGVVQVEMIAQACSFGFIKAVPDAFECNINMALLGITHAKFRKPIAPEMNLIIKTRCLKLRGGFMSSEGKIYDGEELLSEASIFASIKFD